MVFVKALVLPLVTVPALTLRHSPCLFLDLSLGSSVRVPGIFTERTEAVGAQLLVY